LKHVEAVASSFGTTLSALDPGKQGLKLFLCLPIRILSRLSALDPGKQGLKHVLAPIADQGIFTFSA